MHPTKQYLLNIIQDWLDRHGFEPPVDPANPDWLARIDPMPEPWRIVRQFVQAAQAKNLAGRLPDGPLKAGLLRSSSLAISQLLDDTCGTPAHRWPWPGPPPQVWQIASELSTFANNLPAGSLQDEVLDIAGKVVSHTTAPTKAD